MFHVTVVARIFCDFGDHFEEGKDASFDNQNR